MGDIIFMSDRRNNFLLPVGLHCSGKSTFIAALTSLVNKNDALDFLDDESHEYCQSLYDRYLDGKPVEHTSFHTKQIIKFSIGQHIKISILDSAGENFNQFWNNRVWDQYFDNIITNSCGILLFINPETVLQPVRVNEVFDIFTRCCENQTRFKTLNFYNNIETNRVSWDQNNVPTQVKLVDILQFIAEHNKKQHKLAIIISAWDIVWKRNKHRISPVLWLHRHLPLLFQFAYANYDLKKNFRVYGVSQQGGEYIEGNYELFQDLDQSTRIILFEQNANQCCEDVNKSIIEIFKWLIT